MSLFITVEVEERCCAIVGAFDFESFKAEHRHLVRETFYNRVQSKIVGITHNILDTNCDFLSRHVIGQSMVMSQVMTTSLLLETGVYHL